MPSNPSPLDALLAHTRETSLLESTMAVLEWDEHTGLPEQAAEHRADQLALLSGLVHRRRTDPRVGEWIASAADHPEALDPHTPIGAFVRCMKRDYERHIRLPESLVKAISHATSLGQQVWVKAKRENDFAAFAPNLTEIVRLRREEANLLSNPGQSPYDALLDQYEEGAKSQDVKRVFEDLKQALVPLIQSAADAPRRDPRWQSMEFDVDSQRAFSHWVAERIGFDFSRGRLDETEHPFCTTLGPHDHRILTRYDLHSFSSGLYGVLHEAGHGMYEQGFDMEWFGTPVASAASLGVHESQSRLWENLVGLAEPFWQWCLPHARDWFPQLEPFSVDAMVSELIRIQPSLIRIESDEVTYNLHILIRFELELALIQDQLPVGDLPAAWAEQYESTLGIRPENDSVGVLQDVHWAAGLIGYFPTYTLGNIYSAQLFEAADRDLGGVHDSIRRGQFEPLLDWLRSRIHHFGRRYEPMQLIERASGTPVTSAPLIRHLTRKVQLVRGE
jgi:carboxypeptidase Taq